MPSSVPSIPTLSGAGATIPRLGLGTWQLRGEVCQRIVAAALRIRYTQIDTAQGYGNEEAVGGGIAASGLARERLFITTKVQPERMGDGDLQRSVEEGLRKLRVSQVDLLLLHWPNPVSPLAVSIRALNSVKRDGLGRHIGLSNFTGPLLAEAWRLTTEPFAAEQIEYHPFLDQARMREALRRGSGCGAARPGHCRLLAACRHAAAEPVVNRNRWFADAGIHAFLAVVCLLILVPIYWIVSTS